MAIKVCFPALSVPEYLHNSLALHAQTKLGPDTREDRSMDFRVLTWRP